MTWPICFMKHCFGTQKFDESSVASSFLLNNGPSFETGAKCILFSKIAPILMNKLDQKSKKWCILFLCPHSSFSTILFLYLGIFLLLPGQLKRIKNDPMGYTIKFFFHKDFYNTWNGIITAMISNKELTEKFHLQCFWVLTSL